MSDYTVVDKVSGDSFSADEHNQIKTAINSKVDKSGTKVLSDENYTSAEKTKLAGLATVDEAYLLALIQTLTGYDPDVPKALIIEDGQLKLLPVQINEP